MVERSFKLHILLTARYYFYSYFFPLVSKKKTNGYISQPLINTAKKTKHQWYNFQLQTAPSKVRSIARFNTSIHPHTKLCQDSNMPLRLKDIIVKEDESDWLFNQQSTAYLPSKFWHFISVWRTRKIWENYQPILSTDAYFRTGLNN